MRKGREEGVGVVLVLALMSGLLVLASTAVGVGVIFVVHRKAQTAADLAALAAAQALRDGADSCAAATRVAVANGASISTCSTDGRLVDVVVRSLLPTALGGRAISARARAGPSVSD